MNLCCTATCLHILTLEIWNFDFQKQLWHLWSKRRRRRSRWCRLWGSGEASLFHRWRGGRRTSTGSCVWSLRHGIWKFERLRRAFYNHVELPVKNTVGDGCGTKGPARRLHMCLRCYHALVLDYRPPFQAVGYLSASCKNQISCEDRNCPNYCWSSSTVAGQWLKLILSYTRWQSVGNQGFQCELITGREEEDILHHWFTNFGLLFQINMFQKTISSYYSRFIFTMPNKTRPLFSMGFLLSQRLESWPSCCPRPYPTSRPPATVAGTTSHPIPMRRQPMSCTQLCKQWTVQSFDESLINLMNGLKQFEKGKFTAHPRTHRTLGSQVPETYTAGELQRLRRAYAPSELRAAAARWRNDSNEEERSLGEVGMPWQPQKTSFCWKKI